MKMKSFASVVVKSTYEFVSRGLFNNDRLVFALSITHSQYPQYFGSGEWELFTNQIIAEQSEKAIKIPSWVPPERIQSLSQLLMSIPSLSGVANINDIPFWTNWITSSQCEKEWKESGLSPFQKVLFIQALRPDRLQSACKFLLIHFSDQFCV
jgi:dynein heavy chain 2